MAGSGENYRVTVTDFDFTKIVGKKTSNQPKPHFGGADAGIGIKRCSRLIFHKSDSMSVKFQMNISSLMGGETSEDIIIQRPD